MIKKLFGFAFIITGIVLEFFWLGFCFGSIIIGILLLVFAPRILFFPFTFFLLLGLKLIYADAFRRFEEARRSGYQSGSYSYSFHGSYGSANSSSSTNAGGYTPHINKMDAYYKELESTPSDSFEMVKKNYRRLMKEHHYDSLVSKGLPKEMLEFSEEKTKRLNEAYAAIKEQRG
jgi:hypothetical protein